MLEKDQLNNKNKEFIYKLQSLNEKMQDKDEKIDTLGSKFDILS